MMKKKKGNLLEQHAEKLVLGLSAIISLALLWFFVIGSPNAVQIGSRKLGPGQVDRQISQQAKQLEARLNEPPVIRPPSGTNASTQFAKRLESPLEALADVELIVPGHTLIVEESPREYVVPAVPPAQEAVAESIRGTAHVPLEEVTLENPYDKTPTTLKDIDLVTVQASFDVAALYRNFKQSFVMGRSVRSDWKDDELAAPVFASAQLQRRRLLDDGTWSNWEVVPRPKIDSYRVRLDIPEKVEALKYDLAMQKEQLKPFPIQQDILQPRPYDFASSDTLWLTPSFYDEYMKILDREQKEKLRLERERTLDSRSRTSATGYDTGRRTNDRDTVDTSYGDPRSTRTTNPRDRQVPGRTRSNDPSLRGRQGAYDEYTDDGYGIDDPTRRRQQQQQRTANDVVADNSKIIIDERTKLEDKQPLIFWAHDDTIEPDNTYEYRIRLGVFNPIAGKPWFSPQDQKYKDQVILWSEFAAAPDPVVIPPMVYFFPTELARSAENGVTIEVAKYHMGNWRKQGFDVRPGEMIGKPVDVQPTSPLTGRTAAYDRTATYDEYALGGPVLPEKIDFGTGAMLVDLVRSEGWTGVRMIRAEVIDALYTSDGLTMHHVPVRKNNWTSDMKIQYGQIEDAEKKIVQINTGRSQTKIDVFRPQAPAYPSMYPDGRRPYDYGDRDRAGSRYMDVGVERRL